MADQVVELVLRARNEADKAFNELKKTVKGVNDAIQQTVDTAGSSQTPRFFTTLLKATEATLRGATKLKKNYKTLRFLSSIKLRKVLKN